MAQSSAQRQAKWRAAHPALAREVSRTAQQKLRDKLKDAKPAGVDYPDTQPEYDGPAMIEWARATLRVPPGHHREAPADPTAAAAATAAEAAHDDLVTGQITGAWNFISEATGRGYSDLGSPALRSAAVLLVRELYGGYREIKPSAAFYRADRSLPKSSRAYSSQVSPRDC